jgi:hypothetical protein
MRESPSTSLPTAELIPSPSFVYDQLWERRRRARRRRLFTMHEVNDELQRFDFRQRPPVPLRANEGLGPALESRIYTSR